MAETNLGRVAIVPKGTYSASVQYYYLDLVYYQGSSYLVHTQPTIGTLPTDTDYFYLAAEGAEVEMRYDSATDYIQWKLITDTTWNNLIQPADFTPTIVQGIGVSESDIMSQDAVTEEILNLENMGDIIFDMVQGKDVVLGNDSTFSGAGNWVTALGSPTFDVNTTVAGKLYIDFTGATNQAVKLPDTLIVGKKYNVSFKARLRAGDGNSIIRLGMFSSSNNPDALRITPEAIERTYIGTITASNTILYLGAVETENDGSEYEFDDIVVRQQFLVTEETSNEVIAPVVSVLESNTESLYDSVRGKNMVIGNDSTFSGAGNWVTGLGSPVFDINSTVAGKLYINFEASTSQGIKLPDVLSVGKRYNISIKARLRNGNGNCILRIGDFTSANNDTNLRIVPNGAEIQYIGSIVPAFTNLYIGCISSENDGSEYEFDDVIVKEDYVPSKGEWNTEQFLMSISKYDKPLTKICVEGDSLMANDAGGAIPVEYDEGTTMRPLRLNYNTISRRMYDLLSWNKATHRRADHSDWIKSGTWGTISEGLFEGGQDIFYTSAQANAYMEITIPNGKENFAFICHRDAGLGVLNITLNGGSIAAYGNASIDLDRVRDFDGDTGNAFHTELYTGLPAGNNVIRISKENNTEQVDIWGGFYWTGNTIVVHNIAHGGHNLETLYLQHIQAELVENDFDAILFELPLMNEASLGGSVALAQSYLEKIIKEVIGNKDVCFTSCHPFGIDPRDLTPNYYTLYPSPSMEDFNNWLKNTLYINDIPFVDLFSFFKKKIENRGGTLEGGESGLWYTIDGQHQSEAGMLEFWNLMRFIFENKPIRY